MKAETLFYFRAQGPAMKHRKVFLLGLQQEASLSIITFFIPEIKNPKAILPSEQGLENYLKCWCLLI